MVRFTSFFVLTHIALFSGATLAQPFAHGNWEFEVSYDLIGIPQTFPGYTVKQCLDTTTPFPNISRPGNNCQTQLQGRFGRTYTWMLNCSDDWEMVQGMGRIHYRQGEAHGDVHLQILNPHNTPQLMKFRIKGKRTGPCDNANRSLAPGQ